MRPDSSTGRLVANIDIAPTVYHATGVEPAHVMDGRSLLKRGKRRFLLLEHWEGTRWLSIRSRRYQYIEYYSRDGQKIRFRELYKLKRDPWQLRNLLHKHPRRHRGNAARLHRLLSKKAKMQGRGVSLACAGVEQANSFAFSLKPLPFSLAPLLY